MGNATYSTLCFYSSKEKKTQKSTTCNYGYGTIFLESCEKVTPMKSGISWIYGLIVKSCHFGFTSVQLEEANLLVANLSQHNDNFERFTQEKYSFAEKQSSVTDLSPLSFDNLLLNKEGATNFSVD